jgi:hypothetical protein
MGLCEVREQSNIGTVVFTEMFHTDSRDLHQYIETNNQQQIKLLVQQSLSLSLSQQWLLAQVKRG